MLIYACNLSMFVNCYNYTPADVLSTLQIGVNKATISDRDWRFMSEMWTALFGSFMCQSPHHLQTDDTSEITNQTAEKALRFHIRTLNNSKHWPKALPCMQALLDNSKSSTTTQTPNEVAYGLSPYTALDLLKSIWPRKKN